MMIAVSYLRILLEICSPFCWLGSFFWNELTGIIRILALVSMGFMADFRWFCYFCRKNCFEFDGKKKIPPDVFRPTLQINLPFPSYLSNQFSRSVLLSLQQNLLRYFVISDSCGVIVVYLLSLCKILLVLGICQLPQRLVQDAFNLCFLVVPSLVFGLPAFSPPMISFNNSSKCYQCLNRTQLWCQQPISTFKFYQAVGVRYF